MAKDRNSVLGSVLIGPDKKQGVTEQARLIADNMSKKNLVWVLGAAFMTSVARLTSLKFKVPGNIKDPAKITAKLKEAKAKVAAAPEQRLFASDQVSCRMRSIGGNEIYILTDVKLILAFVAEICYRKGVVFALDALQKMRAMACWSLEHGYTPRLFAIRNLSYVSGCPVGLVDPLDAWMSSRSEEETNSMLSMIGLANRCLLAAGETLREKATTECRAVVAIVEFLGLDRDHRKFVGPR